MPFFKRKTGYVEAIQLRERISLHGVSGEEAEGYPGDWLVIENGKQAIYRQEEFHVVFQPYVTS